MLTAECTHQLVEVSGWGPGTSFFLERAELETVDGAKHVRLHEPMHAGALLFIRFVKEVTAQNLYPLVYRIEEVGAPSPDGLRDVRIERLGTQRY